MYSILQPHKTTVRDNEISELAATIESFTSGANIGKVIMFILPSNVKGTLRFVKVSGRGRVVYCMNLITQKQDDHMTRVLVLSCQNKIFPLPAT